MLLKLNMGKKKHTVECSIVYVDKRPLYKVCFGVNFAREVCNSGNKLMRKRYHDKL